MVEKVVMDPRGAGRVRCCMRRSGLFWPKRALRPISVQDIAERSTVNRATFYDHFTDKFALLEDMIGEEFRATFLRRMEESPAPALGPSGNSSSRFAIFWVNSHPAARNTSVNSLRWLNRRSNVW